VAGARDLFSLILLAAALFYPRGFKPNQMNRIDPEPTQAARLSLLLSTRSVLHGSTDRSQRIQIE